MRDWPVRIRKSEHASPQAQIREALVSAILEGRLAHNEPVPSTRRMAGMLAVPRRTVVLAYQGLLDDGYLTARERSGYYVSEKAIGISPQYKLPLPRPRLPAVTHASDHSPLWEGRLTVRPTRLHGIATPVDWMNYRYPFVSGQVDHKLFPIAEWRACARQALGKRRLSEGASDSRAADDPLLVEQIRRRILPKRGIMASESQILITQGARNALFLLVRLLVGGKTRVVMEEPGCPDLRHLLSLSGGTVAPVPVDEGGLDPARLPTHPNVVFTTPSHQFPTTVNTPPDRRRALLAAAAERDFVVVEDGCEFGTSYANEPAPALKALDRDGRVVYVGSLSKTLPPGTRLGFLVGPERVVEEARALYRLMLGGAHGHHQRTAALFLSLGHHDGLTRKQDRLLRTRREVVGAALGRHLPGARAFSSPGGASFWVKGPDGLDSDRLALAAAEQGVVLQSGRVCFAAAPQPCNFFRLGFSSIDESRIEPGIKLIAEIISEISTDET